MSIQVFVDWISECPCNPLSTLNNGLLPPNYPSDPLSPVIKANHTHIAHGLPYAIRDRLSNRTEKQDAFEADQGVKFSGVWRR